MVLSPSLMRLEQLFLFLFLGPLPFLLPRSQLNFRDVKLRILWATEPRPYLFFSSFNSSESIVHIRSGLLVYYNIVADDGKTFPSMQGRRSISSRREAPRLPRIAPRTGTGPSTPHMQRPIPPPRTVLLNTPRTRLPPRSRSGCWTCRRRIKCDEQRPSCRQCARLGHDCDYNPRLAFKDDTSTAMKRTQDVTTIGSSVWDPSLPTPEYCQDRSGQDLLPPFSALTTDEDREKKAQTQKPGTFLVIANQNSFTGLPEYCEDGPPTFLPVSGPSDSSTQEHRAQNIIGIQSTTEELDDPNIILLQTFEDYLRPSSVSAFPKSSPLFATSSHLSTTFETPAKPVHFSNHSNVSRSKLDEARSGGRDAHLLKHYRSHISEHVIKVGSRDVEEDAFEIQARTFPPLFHAMMAISALSLAHRAGTQSAEALEHYAQVLPAMRQFVQREEDPNSDGPLFTHYLLLLYEIASAGPWESNMWQNHSRTLLQIVSRRRQANRTEPHGFLVLVICLIDTYALLSGSGDGAFVNFILKNAMLSPIECLPPLAPGHPQLFFDEELPFFPGVLELNQKVISLATKVGETARTLRIEGSQRRVDGIAGGADEHRYNVSRQNRIRAVQTLCRTSASKWEVRYPQYWPWQPAPKTLPRRVRGFCDHIYTLYRACVIYSYTSIHPDQMADLTSDGDAAVYVSTCVTELIEIAQQVVMDERWELQFIPFSLFLSGVVSRKKEEKTLALNLLSALGRESYGENTATMRRLLETIYDKQQAGMRNGKQDPEVDWLEVMETSGLRLVMFGM